MLHTRAMAQIVGTNVIKTVIKKLLSALDLAPYKLNNMILASHIKCLGIDVSMCNEKIFSFVKLILIIILFVLFEKQLILHQIPFINASFCVQTVALAFQTAKQASIRFLHLSKRY